MDVPKAKNRNFSKFLKILEFLHMNYPKEFFFWKIWWLFVFTFFPNFWKVLDDSPWQVHLRMPNIYSKSFYMFLTHEKHHKTNFFGNLGIFRNSWLFSESFGYFLRHSYLIWLIWQKIWILQIILDYTDISNRSLGELGL